jgi:hypothetical protein
MSQRRTKVSLRSVDSKGEIKSKNGIAVLLMLLSTPLYTREEQDNASVSGNGWTISVDEKGDVLNIANASLGIDFWN